jgi:2-polyprenyl-3-methyl-5-hydroxy-6-metoxy-1,4-benzoquinol methylase
MEKPAAEEQTAAAPHGTRSPLKAVQCLLPVWGYEYVRQFFDLGLPTWLAPGNIPALVADLPTEFVILTSREDEIYIRSHTAFRRLCDVCPTSLHFVDHLITGNNYSTTITMAYLEAVRATGAAMTDTCFIFLVSDYIVADGSFATLLRRMKAGISGIQVGNFQVVREDALPWVVEQLASSPDRLALSPRELMRWALSHLHPATVANTINFPYSHNDHTNRLFWRADSRTLLGRFFLMHMIAIRPERQEFVIGSSCDYSFIPEMCPSDNVEIIGDSDDYLVIEMQPRHHESWMVKTGPQSVAGLALSLSEWTTARHRKNADTTILFHADEVPPTIDADLAELDSFVRRVKQEMTAPPRPHRSHPYWAGAIAAFNEASGAKLNDNDWRLSLGLPNPDLQRSSLARWFFSWFPGLVFGPPPTVRPVHPRWPDHNLVFERIKSLELQPTSRLLLISDIPTVFTAGLGDGGERVVRLRTSHLLRQSAEVFDPLVGRFDCCLIEINETDMPNIVDLIDRLAVLIKSDARLLVSMTCRSPQTMTTGFRSMVSARASNFVRPYSRAVTFTFVTANTLRTETLKLMIRSFLLVRSRPIAGLLVLGLLGPFLLLGILLGNRMAKAVSTLPRSGGVSSVLVDMMVDQSFAQEAYRYSATRVLRDRQRQRAGYPKEYRLPTRPNVGKAHVVDYILTGQGEPAKELAAIKANITKVNGSRMTETDTAAEHTREPQYNRCLEIKNKQGLTSLGLMTNQVWEDDPRRLTFLLSRYKFVSKMLTGKKFVGELGCGDAFGTRVVMQTVEKVVAYDFDPVFIADIKERRSERWPVEAYFHDILERRLPNVHDAIYSLDVIEHIQSVDENTYLAHLRDSLTDDGVLIIGTPSLESQAYASPPSKEGHVNCKSGNELQALLRNFFSNVFLFSMNDEVVHTGFSPMAHYLFAVCCQKKA